jgi:hypothetical protein
MLRDSAGVLRFKDRIASKSSDGVIGALVVAAASIIDISSPCNDRWFLAARLFICSAISSGTFFIEKFTDIIILPVQMAWFYIRSILQPGQAKSIVNLSIRNGFDLKQYYLTRLTGFLG